MLPWLVFLRSVLGWLGTKLGALLRQPLVQAGLAGFVLGGVLASHWWHAREMARDLAAERAYAQLHAQVAADSATVAVLTLQADSLAGSSDSLLHVVDSLAHQPRPRPRPVPPPPADTTSIPAWHAAYDSVVAVVANRDSTIRQLETEKQYQMRALALLQRRVKLDHEVITTQRVMIANLERGLKAAQPGHHHGLRVDAALVVAGTLAGHFLIPSGRH
jgi:hypothetical protein